MIKSIKQIIFAAFVIMIIGALAGCGNSEVNKDEQKPTIVCTGFAQYDWIKNILGDNLDGWNLIRINDKGVDMHSYQPTADDMISISECDLIIYTGGDSEDWITETVDKNGSFDGEQYELLQHVDVIDDDEHVWLSPKNAIVFCEEITDIISELDSEHAKMYQSNCAKYVEQLENLNMSYENVVSTASGNTIICADRFPFKYLANDYDISYFAAFPGCEAETEASFETIANLSDKLKEYNVNAILVCDGSDESIAQTVIENSGIQDVEIVVMDSMQSVKGSDESADYIDIMESNLNSLQKALN